MEDASLGEKPSIPTYSGLYTGRNKQHIPTRIATRNMVWNIKDIP